MLFDHSLQCSFKRFEKCNEQKDKLNKLENF